MNKVWWFIEGQNKRYQDEWERTRAIAYNVAKFGNSDPKKFPKSIQKFWPFEWERGAPTGETAQQKYERLKKAQEERLKQINGSRRTN